MKHWRKIEEHEGCSTWAMNVPGGVLIKSCDAAEDATGGLHIATSMVHVSGLTVAMDDGEPTLERDVPDEPA